jgi:predicted dinucleotide-binding enzyme
MNIGILGAGNVARALSEAFVARGHAVRIGSRNPKSEKLRWIENAPGAIAAGSMADTARFGEVTILAINPWTEIDEVLKSLGPQLAGKPLIDLSNNIEFGAVPKLAFTDHSMGQKIQRWAPTAHVVKTLNIAIAALMRDPKGRGANPAMMWIAGDHAGAKATVTHLLRQTGWDEIVDLGGIDMSRFQESVSLLVSLAITDLMQAGRCPPALFPR